MSSELNEVYQSCGKLINIFSGVPRMPWNCIESELAGQRRGDFSHAKKGVAKIFCSCYFMVRSLKQNVSSIIDIDYLIWHHNNDNRNIFKWYFGKVKLSLCIFSYFLLHFLRINYMLSAIFDCLLISKFIIWEPILSQNPFYPKISHPYLKNSLLFI